MRELLPTWRELIWMPVVILGAALAWVFFILAWAVCQ